MDKHTQKHLKNIRFKELSQAVSKSTKNVEMNSFTSGAQLAGEWGELLPGPFLNIEESAAIFVKNALFISGLNFCS